ncbi:Protein of unknown function [Gryllus bimaculatus]|nr:Protein of unknown function [Gryllus bimaculatus]
MNKTCEVSVDRPSQDDTAAIGQSGGELPKVVTRSGKYGRFTSMEFHEKRSWVRFRALARSEPSFCPASCFHGTFGNTNDLIREVIYTMDQSEFAAFEGLFIPCFTDLA